MTEPKKLGKYELIEELGRGGFSVVYRATDTTLHNRPVALKVLHPQLLVDPGFVARFKQEAGVAANLHHPNIVTIYEIGESEGWLFIAMELVDGLTLEELVKAGEPLPLERAVPILQQVASALDYAHGQGLIHRDVKPGNILVEPGGRAVLTDFGLVKATEGTTLTSAGQILGTPEYMSPEQAEGEALDRRSDLYSLGVVLYEMVTGQAPFKAPTPSAVLYKHVHEPPPPPLEINPTLPPAVEPMLLKALAKRPEDRHQSGAEMVAALQAAQTPAVGVTPAAALAPAVEEARPALPPPPFEPHPARCWPLWVAGLGIVLGLIALIACLAVLVGVVAPGGQPTSTPVVRTTTDTPSATLPPTNTPTVTPTPTSTPTRTPKPTAPPATIRWKKDGKEMVLVPAGEFLMGSTDADSAAASDEKPQHKVYLNAFYIDKTEVTNAEYKRFVDATGHRVPGHWTNGQIPAGLENHPVVNVSWWDASAYAAWAGKRLPTEEEWEKAARGTDGRDYPWGTWAEGRCNTGEAGVGGTTPVGKYSPGGDSPYGCADMAGNVWEWTASWYEEGKSRVLRGGSWDHNRGLARCASRLRLEPDYVWNCRGFRVVVVSPISPGSAL